MNKIFLNIALAFLMIFSCDSSNNLKNPIQTIEAITLLGDTLRSPEIKMENHLINLIVTNNLL